MSYASISRACASLVLIAAILAVTGTAFAGGKPQPAPFVYPVELTPYGNSYGDWSALWWQWAFAIPAGPGHPLFDETGADCGVAQSGQVWFLGGVFNASGSATRECTVPAGKALFFPIINVECSNVEGNGTDAVGLRACADFYVSLAENLLLEIDGYGIPTNRLRMSSPTFNFTLPEDNILGAPLGTCVVDGDGICQANLSVSDGYYVMVAPMSPGDHTIHFRGTFGDPINFTLEITYNLTVQ